MFLKKNKFNFIIWSIIIIIFTIVTVTSICIINYCNAIEVWERNNVECIDETIVYEKEDVIEDAEVDEVTEREVDADFQKEDEQTNEEKESLNEIEDTEDYDDTETENIVSVNEKKETEIKKRENQEEKEDLYCTIEVRCDKILDNIIKLDNEKKDLVPEDGVILSTKEVVFEKGESVFDVLLRVLKKEKIHIEFVKTPVNDNVYIEGINNIYEFDCGELSGWMYRINGKFPNYGCGEYYLEKGDAVEFIYTCDLGRDIGGEYISQK